MEKIRSQIEQFSHKYEPYFMMAFNNMRLVLLITFTVLCGVLVLRINSLIGSPLPSIDVSKSSTSQVPDKDVTAVFKELQTKQVSLDSNFQDTRSNPF